MGAADRVAHGVAIAGPSWRPVDRLLVARTRSLPPVSTALLAVLMLVLVGVAVLPSASSAGSLDDVRDERRTLQSRLDAAAERLGDVEDRVALAESRTQELESEASALD